MPPSIESWVVALQSVDKDSGRIRDSASKMKGYRFPDPGLFISTSLKNVYLATWLSARPAWMWGMAKEISPAGSGPVRVPSQWWRDFLRRGCFPTDPSSHALVTSKAKTTKGPSKTELRNKDVTRIFCHHMGAELKIVDSVFWRGKQLTQEGIARLDPGVTAEILWDLYEHNWRLELVSLDRVVVLTLWWRGEPQNRDSLIKSLFHNNDYLVSQFPTSDQGLAALVWKDRAPYLKIFREIMSAWPGFPRDAKGLKLTSPGEVAFVEKLLANFYCQTFFDFSGRAPITPHRLPLVMHE
jgi:hypothetical protein